jgi:oxygen-dependent protoporphyrinogen oxidase
MDDTRAQVAVVGAGVSGLALGFQLQQRGVDVCVLEAHERAGGNIRSERRDAYLCEWGPNGWLDNEPATGRLIDVLGLGEQVVRASDAAALRWIVRDGKLRALPMRPSAFLGSDVLSLRGKLRVLTEWAQPARRDGGDESVFDFAARRIGREAAEVLVDAMVTGIYAGDSRSLSLRSTFPRMHDMESQHGGLFKAMRAVRRERRARGDKAKGGGPAGPAGTLHSFAGGMQSIVDALVRRLGQRLRLGTTVERVAPRPGGWRLTLSHASTPVPEALECDSLVVASPAWSAAALLRELDAPLADALAAIPSAPVAVVCLGFRDTDVQHVERGFGFLAPGCEKLPVLGTLFDTWVFPSRSPDGHVLTRTMIGGAREPGALQEDDAQLVERAVSILGLLLDVRADATMSYVVRHPRGIPQYVVGHGEIMRRIDERTSTHPGLFLCGNSYRGVAMNACIKEAESLAKQIATAGALDSTGDMR